MKIIGSYPKTVKAPNTWTTHKGIISLGAIFPAAANVIVTAGFAVTTFKR